MAKMLIVMDMLGRVDNGEFLLMGIEFVWCGENIFELLMTVAQHCECS